MTERGKKPFDAAESSLATQDQLEGLIRDTQQASHYNTRIQSRTLPRQGGFSDCRLRASDMRHSTRLLSHAPIVEREINVVDRVVCI